MDRNQRAQLNSLYKQSKQKYFIMYEECCTENSNVSTTFI